MEQGFKTLNAGVIKANLQMENLSNVIVFPTVDSTSEVCKSLYRRDFTENIVVVANEQLMGKGRKGRTFLSPKDGLYTSILYFPERLTMKQIQFVTICMSLAVCETIEKYYEIHLDIKWLNDIYLNGKKIAGILTEGKFKQNHCEYLVVGVGVNAYEIDIPNELKDKVTTIQSETGIIVDRNLIIFEMYNRFFHYMALLEKDDYSFLDKYRQRNFLINRNVTLVGESEIYLVTSINQDGHLVIQNEDGEKILNAEEVSIYGWK